MGTRRCGPEIELGNVIAPATVEYRKEISGSAIFISPNIDADIRVRPVGPH
jgi:hypothetical protein